MRITISNHPLLFDWGTLEIIGEVTGRDPANPIAEDALTADKALYMFYGGYKRAAEEDGIDGITLAGCRQLMRSMLIPDVAAIIRAFTKAMSVDAEPDQYPEKKTE
jgi:hypothetical protein